MSSMVNSPTAAVPQQRQTTDASKDTNPLPSGSIRRSGEQ